MNRRIIFFLEHQTGTFFSYFEFLQKSNFETKVFKLEKKSSLKEKVKYIRSIISELKGFNPDFIYINDEFFSKNTLFITFLRRLFSKKSKIITFIASRYIPEYNLLNKIKLHFLLKNIDFLFCRNKKELKKIKNIDLFKNYSKLYQIYWGLPKRVFYRINQTKKEICDSFLPLKKIYPKIKNKYILGFVGRISQEKGIDIILESLNKLPKNLIFLYVGRIEDIEYQKKLSNFIKENNLTNRVIYLGFIENEKLRYIYNILDLIILPTTKKYDPLLEELFGAVLAESMLCKTLVIGSNNGAIPEVIGRKDLIFEEDNPKDLSRAINYICNLRQEEKEKIINLNYDRAINNFSSEKFVENIKIRLLNL